MSRKITYIIGVVVLTIAITGCGKKESASTEIKSDTVTEETETTEGMQETEKDDQEEEETESSTEAQEYSFGYEEIEGGIRINQYFSEGEVENVEIPEEIDGKTVLEIGGMGSSIKVFSQEDSLKEVAIPDSVGFIGDNTFYYCKNLEIINFGNGLKQIGYEAFFCCEKLKSIELPEGLQIIDNGAFMGCTNLEKAIIPNSVTEIKDGNFPACSENIVIVTPSGSYAEEYAKSLDLTVENN